VSLASFSLQYLIFSFSSASVPCRFKLTQKSRRQRAWCYKLLIDWLIDWLIAVRSRPSQGDVRGVPVLEPVGRQRRRDPHPSGSAQRLTAERDGNRFHKQVCYRKCAVFSFVGHALLTGAWPGWCRLVAPWSYNLKPPYRTNRMPAWQAALFESRSTKRTAG